MAHDDVTCSGTARKIFYKINCFAPRIDLCHEIFMPRPRNLLRNSLINFRICSNFLVLLIIIINPQKIIINNTKIHNTWHLWILDLEMAYDTIDRQGMWQMLRVYGVGGKLCGQ